MTKNEIPNSVGAFVSRMYPGSLEPNPGHPGILEVTASTLCVL